MMNETPEFPMPKLLDLGTDRMLEKAKADGLVVPLRGYKIYVSGVATSGITPQEWMAIHRFWMIYFRATGADLISYSADCEVAR